MPVIQVFVAGVRVAHCGPRCYNGRGSTCRCICRGENHGVGLEQAELNTAISGEEWLHHEVLHEQLDAASVTCRILGAEAMVPLLV